MKKNLRIVSAAAAALLAVAPVAASAVSTVNAATGTTATADAPTGGNPDVNIPNIDAPASGSTSNTDLTDAEKLNIKALIPTATTLSSTPNLNTWGSSFDASKIVFTYSKNGAVAPEFSGIKFAPEVNVFKSSTKDVTDPAAEISGKDPIKNGEKLEAGNTYIVRLSATINTPTPKNKTDKYTINGTSMRESSSQSNTLANVPVYAVVHVVDKVEGQPFVSMKKANDAFASFKSLANGQVAAQYKHVNSVTEMVNKINEHNWKLNQGSSDKSPVPYAATQESVKEQLKAAKIDVKSDGTFSIPKGGFYYTITAKNYSNNATATARVFFDESEAEYKNYPLIWFKTTSSDDQVKQGDHDFGYKMPILTLPLGQRDWADYLAKKFHAQESSYNGNAVTLTGENISASSDFNTNKKGLYTVTLKATNADKLTTELKFDVAVIGSEKDVIENKTVIGSNNEVVQLVKIINGETSYLTGDVVNQGEILPVYVNDTTTDSNGVSYTRVYQGNDREKTNVWIPTKNITEPVKEESVDGKVMYKSALYEVGKDGKTATNSGKSIAGYTDGVKFVKGEDGKAKVYTLTVNGVEGNFFKIANENQYVRVRNVEGSGSKMTLKHNAYVYKSNGKRYGKKTIKKGHTIEVFGGKCTMKKYKKAVVRIGVNQYVKVANIKSFKLAK